MTKITHLMIISYDKTNGAISYQFVKIQKEEPAHYVLKTSLNLFGRRFISKSYLDEAIIEGEFYFCNIIACNETKVKLGDTGETDLFRDSIIHQYELKIKNLKRDIENIKTQEAKNVTWEEDKDD